VHKIKVAGVFIFVLSLVLALLFATISKLNKINTASLSIINEQKSTTQEISKTVLYISKNRGSSNEQLNAYIENFLVNMTHEKETSPQHEVLLGLWNEFYVLVEKFKKQQEVTTAYSSMSMDTLVNDIYMKNQKLIVAFNTFIDNKQNKYDEKVESYKKIQYVLFLVLVLLLIYLFTQVREVIAFIQKFSSTSKSIMQRATIKGLKPMKIRQNDEDLKEVTQNFNHLVEKIDLSIVYAKESIEHTTVALETVEQKIEDMMTLIAQMQEEESDVLYQKEDAVIDSLETLMSLTNKLKNLQQELNKLTSSSNNH